MNPIDILLINVGSNGNEKNGIAPIYSSGTFEYWPIEESFPGRKTPRFRDLNIKCDYPDLYAHHDPCFEPSPSYGDVMDLPAFRSLKQSIKPGKNPLLLFAATLKYAGEAAMCPSWILQGIGYYIIGFFLVKEIRFAEADGRMNWKGHEENAHYLRSHYKKRTIKVLVGGGRGSRLLRKPFPISVRPKTKLEPNSWLTDHFRELRGGAIGGGPWYRRTFRNSPRTTTKSIIDRFVSHEK